jgi:hypothetical protein
MAIDSEENSNEEGHEAPGLRILQERPSSECGGRGVRLSAMRQGAAPFTSLIVPKSLVMALPELAKSQAT